MPKAAESGFCGPGVYKGVGFAGLQQLVIQTSHELIILEVLQCSEPGRRLTGTPHSYPLAPVSILDAQGCGDVHLNATVPHTSM